MTGAAEARAIANEAARRTPHRTIWQSNAVRFSTRDRIGIAEAVMDVACKESVAAFRAGDAGKGLRVLAKAQRRASRILGQDGAA